MKNLYSREQKGIINMNEFFGESGQLVDMPVTVDRVIGIQSTGNNVKRLIVMEDNDGRTFIAFSSIINPISGAQYRMTGIIINHNVRNGVRQTVLRELKLTFLPGWNIACLERDHGEFSS